MDADLSYRDLFVAYSAFASSAAASSAGASAFVSSAAGASAGAAASAFGADLRERRVDFFLVSFAISGSKSTSSMNQTCAASP